MSSSEAFARSSAELARALLRAERPSASARLDNAFRRNITAFGFDAGRVLDNLEVPYRSYASPAYLPGRVVVIAASSWDKDLPNAEVVEALLVRGGTAIIAGDTLADIAPSPRVLRIEPPFDPSDDPRAEADTPTASGVTPADLAVRLGIDPGNLPRTPAFDEEALEEWAKKLMHVAKLIADAL